MDYDRVEQLSKKLYNARIETRFKSASNLLFKIESGIADGIFAESTCTATLLDGILQSLKYIVDRPTDLIDLESKVGELLAVLLKLVRQVPVADHSRQATVEISSKILEILYQLKNFDGLTNSLIDSIDQVFCFCFEKYMLLKVQHTTVCGNFQTIDFVCGLNPTQASSRPNLSVLEQRALELMTQNAAPSLEAKAAAASRFQGAGAILNSRLVYAGWKFPPFVLTERDERWLFDAEVLQAAVA